MHAEPNATFVHFSEVIRSLADNPEKVHVTISNETARGTLIEVQAPQEEVGRLIGINGRTARALRLLLQGVSLARGKRCELDIKTI